MKCDILKKFYDLLKEGKDPNAFIPWSMDCLETADKETLIEIYAFCVQYLTDGREVVCKQKLEELMK